MESAFVAIVLSTLTLLANAQGVQSVAEVRKITDDVMSKVGKGELEAGLRTFKSLTIIPEAEFEAMLGQAITQLPIAASRFGPVAGSEFLREDRIGESLARFVYIQKFDKHALRWIFYLYKGKSGWVINTFRFDDKWPELFSGG